PSIVGVPLIQRTRASVQKAYEDTEALLDEDVDRARDIFEQIWGPGSQTEFFGPVIKNILTMCIKTLMVVPSLSFSEMSMLLHVESFRKYVVSLIPDQYYTLRAFWQQNFEKLLAYERLKRTASTDNKLDMLLNNELVRLIASQPHPTVDF